ncbi:MAG: hypothetical protein E7657_02740 [Ruminococcaceae bacterium]|nr:hypothetical protein [Oscillospiraceae bacterium]
MENNTFNYNYSATQNREVEKIRSKYVPKVDNKLERLKKLDARVEMAGMLESLSLGIIGALLFGVGMCFSLGVFVGTAWHTALFMVFGILLMLPAYPVYKRIARETKAELTPEILRLSEEIMKSAKN